MRDGTAIFIALWCLVLLAFFCAFVIKSRDKDSETTETTSITEEVKTPASEDLYAINLITQEIHNTDCDIIKAIKEEYISYTDSYEELGEAGYAIHDCIK